MPIQDPLTQQIIGLCYRIANALGQELRERMDQSQQESGRPGCHSAGFFLSIREMRCHPKQCSSPSWSVHYITH
jgi:hypothetical protein